MVSYIQKIKTLHKYTYINKDIYPNKQDVLKSFELTPFEDVKVVILGQDPYYNPGLANGLAFGVPIKFKDKLPPSLSFIKYSLKDCYLGTLNLDKDCTLETWAKQGVLLLNTSLTVAQGIPNSHAFVWRSLIEKVINDLSLNKQNICFLLWGKNAISFKKYIDTTKHFVFESDHPIKAKMSFKGGFKECNDYLILNNKNHVYW